MVGLKVTRLFMIGDLNSVTSLYGVDCRGGRICRNQMIGNGVAQVRRLIMAGKLLSLTKSLKDNLASFSLRNC